MKMNLAIPIAFVFCVSSVPIYAQDSLTTKTKSANTILLQQKEVPDILLSKFEPNFKKANLNRVEAIQKN